MTHSDQQISDIGLVGKGLALLNIDVSLRATGRCHYAVSCRYINSEDGSLRWIWPSSAKSPDFLRFRDEQQDGFARKIRMAFRLGLGGTVSSGSVVLYTTAIGIRALRQLSSWAIATGTPGPDRKMLIWHKNSSGHSAFTKLSLSVSAAKNIYQERMANLQSVPACIAQPVLINTRCLAFTQEDLASYSTGATTVADLAELPQGALQEWLSFGLKRQRLGASSWYREAHVWLHSSKRQKDERISEVLLQKVRTLIDCMLPTAIVPVSTAHGDFIPRNIRVLGEKLALIDWSKSREDLPALYDFFHFVYKTGVEQRRSFSYIRKQIDETLQQADWERFMLEHDIDAGEAEQLYLLCVVSSNLPLLTRQAKWCDRVARMLQVWCEALGFWMDFEGLLTQRQLVLQDLIHYLHPRDYVAMRLSVADITALPAGSMLELCMPKNVSASLIHYLRQHRCVERVRVKSYAQLRQLSVFLSGGSVIHIDCLSELQHGHLVIADLERVLRRGTYNAFDVRVPAFEDELNYVTAQVALTGKPLSHQYRQHLLEQSYHAPDTILEALRQKPLQELLPVGNAAQPDVNRQAAVKKQLSASEANKGFRKVWKLVQWVSDRIRQLVPQRGYIITFSGMDGASKRTVIEATRQRIEQEMHMPVVILGNKYKAGRGRPAIKKDGRKENLASQQSGGPGVQNYLKLLQLSLQYLHSYCSIQLRYVLRGYVVLYDHYYLDIVQDQQKNDVILPATFTNWWYRFLLKPDLNFLLYAPGEISLERRQELSTDMVEQITARYFALFSHLERGKGQGHFFSVRNLKLGDTMETLFRHIKTMEAAA